MKSYIVPLVLSAGLVSGCATASQRPGFREVSQTVEDRTGFQVQWNQGTSEDAQVADRLQALLQQELTAETAVQIALLNNAALQAAFEELGIAQADLVQAGLLKNPVFAGRVRFPDKSGESTNTEFSVSEDFIDLFQRPLRKKLASAQWDETKLQVSDRVFHLTTEVRSAYYTLQAAEHSHAMLQTITQAAEAAAELAERQHAAGNINDLGLANEQVAFQQVKLDLIRSEADLLAARERLNRLMGIGTAPTWKISQELPQLPGEEPSAQDLESRALTQRLDLAAARQEIHVREQALALACRGVIPAVNVGIDTERDTDRSRVTGPSFDVELPVFDRKQAPIARAKAELRQSQRRLSVLETQIRSEVRSTRDQVQVARQAIEQYQKGLIPLREQIVAESQKHYNYMLVGIFQVLQAKREEVSAYREYIEAFRDYWTARTELERAIGGRLVSEPAAQPTAASPEQPSIQEPAVPEVAPMHHHGGHS